ncbi:hypothetical protein [Streptomyces sp. NPDC051909]|uniref:hypothetical protein n=1 Tax=Streptomyces sp. NPDC051909 TaxID=3154944 RepID=UPI003444D61F
MTSRGTRHGKPYSAVRRRLQNILVAIGGVLALLTGTVLLTIVLPQASANERAFLSATECRVTSARDCLRAAPFTVESVTIHDGKNAGGRVRLSGAGAGPAPVKFDGVSEFLKRVRPGDGVTGTVWRGEIVALSDGEGGQRTVDHPVGDSLLTVAFGILLLVTGALGAYAAWWWIRCPEHTRRGHPPALAAAGWAATGLVVHTFVLMVALGSQDASLTLFLTLWTPAAAAAGAFLAHRRRVLRKGPRRGAVGRQRTEG